MKVPVSVKNSDSGNGNIGQLEEPDWHGVNRAFNNNFFSMQTVAKKNGIMMIYIQEKYKKLSPRLYLNGHEINDGNSGLFTVAVKKGDIIELSRFSRHVVFRYWFPQGPTKFVFGSSYFVPIG